MGQVLRQEALYGKVRCPLSGEPPAAQRDAVGKWRKSLELWLGDRSSLSLCLGLLEDRRLRRLENDFCLLVSSRVSLSCSRVTFL